MRNNEEYEKIVMVVGGGQLSRQLQAKVNAEIEKEEYLHNIGMSATNTNAAMLQGYIEDADVYIPKSLGDAYEYLIDEGHKTMVTGGLKVGWSTDMDAAVFADMLDENRVYKISDISYVYDQDPKTNAQAKEIKDLTWDSYSDLFDIDETSEHIANKNIPIDVECAKFCARKGITFFISGGKNIYQKKSIEEIIQEGTLIHP
jgi:uridylate kinase